MASQIILGLVLVTLLRATGVVSIPLDDQINELSVRSPKLLHTGVFVDPVNNEPFNLFVEQDDKNSASAFDTYLTAANQTSELEKRRWWDCQHVPNYGYFGCGQRHDTKEFYQATGPEAMKEYLLILLNEAFKIGHEEQQPRANCMTRKDQNLCVSWPKDAIGDLKPGQAVEVSDFAINCAKYGGSAEFRLILNDQTLYFVCVSRRANGCKTSVCHEGAES